MRHRILLSMAIFAGILCQAETMPEDSILTSGTVLRQQDLERQAGLDLRSRLIGQIPGFEVTEHTGQTMRGTTNIGSPWFSSGNITFASKGWTSVSCYVDGVTTPFSQFYLDPNQIESIRFVTDVQDKASVSPLASSGAIMITTKSGSYNTPMKIDVYAESGVGFVDRMPGWSDGVTYARLNNLARTAAGYSALYSEEAIAGYAQGNMFDRRYPNVDYRSLILRDYKPMTRFGFSINGGSANIKYHFALNGLNDGDLFQVGPTADYNKLNFTASITAKIGQWIEARASFLGLIGIQRGNRSSLTSFRSVPGIAFPLAFGKSAGLTGEDGDEAGSTIYAVSRTFTDNPYAKVVDGGFFNARTRSGMFNLDVNFNLGWLLPGLSARSHLNAGTYYFFSVGKNNDYLAYYWDSSDDIVDISTHLGVKQASKSTISALSYQTFNFNQDLAYTLARGNHRFNAKATFNISSTSRSGATYNERLLMGLLTADYNYDNRYAAALTVQYSGASPYAPGVRYAAFPAGNVVWMASNEDFLKDVEWLDRLKIYAQAGRIGYADIFSSNYLYQALYNTSGSAIYGPATAYQWFGTDKQTVSTTSLTRLANPELTWPTIDEVDFGVDFGFLDGFTIGLKGYYIGRKGIHTNTMSEYMKAYGWDGIAYYENYNAKRTLGAELNLGFARTFGDFSLDVNGWATTWRTVNTRVANDLYAYDWQILTGADESAYRGLRCIGRFETPEQIATLPKVDENDTHIGDLMYEDLNGDGLIDDNDRCIIGNTNPWLRYAINIDLRYKDFGLCITGTGRAFYDVALTNEYFWNGWGNNVYSDFVSDNLGGAYPRLSYDKSTTNFLYSDFWLRDGGFFKIKSVELSYTLRPSVKWMESVRFSITGGNLLTLTGLEYVDPENMNAGVTTYPFFRTVMAGVKISF